MLKACRYDNAPWGDCDLSSWMRSKTVRLLPSSRGSDCQDVRQFSQTCSLDELPTGELLRFIGCLIIHEILKMLPVRCTACYQRRSVTTDHCIPNISVQFIYFYFHLMRNNKISGKTEENEATNKLSINGLEENKTLFGGHGILSTESRNIIQGHKK